MKILKKFEIELTPEQKRLVKRARKGFEKAAVFAETRQDERIRFVLTDDEMADAILGAVNQAEA